MEAMNCPICMHEFDDKSRVPLVLHCGHTFCKKCIEDTERRNGAIQCSLCRSLDFREVSIIKKNIILSQNLHPSGKTPLVPCTKHSGQESIFFCLTDNVPFCSKCATSHKSHDFFDIDDPIITQGTDIEMKEKSQKADDLLKKAYDERKKITEIYDNLEQKKNKNIDMINMTFDIIINETKRKREEFIQCLNGKYNSSAKKIQKVIENCDGIIMKKKKSIEELLAARKQIGRLANTERYKAFQELSQIDLTEESVESDIEFLLNDIQEVKLDIAIEHDKVIKEIKQLSPDDSIREEINMWKPPAIDIEVNKSNPLQVNLIRAVMETGIDISEKVRNVLEKTDRKYFMPAECDPYEDRPQRIGYNTTISAPHMHAYTLN